MGQPLLRGRDGDAVAFGAGVILDQDRSPPFDHFCFHVDRAGRGGVDRALQRRDVVARAHLVRQLQHAHEHGRHQLRLRGLVFLDQLQKFLGVEMLHDDGGAAERDRHHVEAQGSRVIERRRRQIDAVRRHAAHVGAQNFEKRVRRIDRIVFECLLDAFGTPGGAGRIQHVVARHFIRDRHGRLLGGFPVKGTEAGLRLVHHVEQRSAHLADETPDLFGAFRRGDEDFCAAIFHDVGDLVLRQIAADRGVIETRALRRPADFHEGEAVFHQERDVVAGLQPERAEQLRTLVRKLVEFAIGDRLAGRRHLVGDLVRVGAGVNGRVGHGCFLNMKMASRKRTPCSPVAKRFSCF